MKIYVHQASNCRASLKFIIFLTIRHSAQLVQFNPQQWIFSTSLNVVWSCVNIQRIHWQLRLLQRLYWDSNKIEKNMCMWYLNLKFSVQYMYIFYFKNLKDQWLLKALTLFVLHVIMHCIYFLVIFFSSKNP